VTERVNLGLAAKAIGVFGLTLIALLAVEHQLHLLRRPQLLLLLLCPLMQFTMHGWTANLHFGRFRILRPVVTGRAFA